VNRSDLNASLGIFGIYLLGIFLIWFPLAFLGVPLPEDPIARSAVTVVLQTLGVIVLPYAWAWWRLGLSPAALGINVRGLGKNIALGCALYALALAAFIHCSDDPVISNHLVGQLGTGEAILFLAVMGLAAAGTDLSTRGFILLGLARYSPVAFAVIIQNLTWVLGHLHEIELLRNCLGVGMAVALTVTLGLLGDVIALKTRNVVGLAIAHILLNVVLVIYIRQL